MNDVLYESKFKDDLYTFGKICSELRSSIVQGTACDSATLRLSDICKIYSVDEVMARAVADTLVSEQYISHRHGNRRYTIEYNAEELKFLSGRLIFLENKALPFCLFQQNESTRDQQLKYKELLRHYQDKNDLSAANIDYICSLFRALSQTEFREIQLAMRRYSKYLQLYWRNSNNLADYLYHLKQFNDACIELDSASAREYMEQMIGKVERHVGKVLDDRETSALRWYDQPDIVGTGGAGRAINRQNTT